MGHTVGVDVGGTKVAAGLVDERGAVLASRQRPTPSTSPAAMAEAIADLVRELHAVAPVEAVGIGAAGWVDKSRSIVLFAPNLAWRDEPLRDEVAHRVGLPVVVENDANAAAWGEYRFGAGRGDDDLVAVTVGTGIGGGLVLDGELYRGAFGLGAEFGHMQVVPGGRVCGCGNRGCWEQYCSGRALVRAARERAALDPDAAKELLRLGDGTVEGISGPHITAAAAAGDPVSIAAFDEVGRALGSGLAQLAAALDPARFVIAGGVIDAGPLLLDPTRESFAEHLSGQGRRPNATIVPAQLGPAAGMIGAADLARRR